MAWNALPTAVSGAAIPASWWNTYIRDNLAETAVAKATTAGSYFVGAGVNVLAERTIGHDFLGTQESTTATSATDLATVGPSLTRTTGAGAIVMVSSTISNNTVGAASLMGYEVSGATTTAFSSPTGIRFISSTANAHMQATGVTYAALTPGSNTFVSKYMVGSGIGTFSNRRLIVMPL